MTGIRGTAAEDLGGGVIMAPPPTEGIRTGRYLRMPSPRLPDGLLVDTALRAAYVDGRILDLTLMEFDLLAHLVRNPRHAHSRRGLLRAVWHCDEGVVRGRTVDVHVARLRRKLGPEYRDGIDTLRGYGYRLHPGLHVAPGAQVRPGSPAVPRESPESRESLDLRLAAVADQWHLRWSEHARRLPSEDGSGARAAVR